MRTILLISTLEYAYVIPTLFFTPLAEICDNAKDDDGDGLIDLNDNDCVCQIIAPVSLIPNPSFEETNCCPSAQSQLNCANSWIQASVPTTDLLHTCGWKNWPDFPAPFPFPDGNGAMGFRDGRVTGNSGTPEMNWKEYAGACLLSPLKAGTTYLFEFHVGFVNSSKSPPINITFFGTPDCSHLPFGTGNAAFGCPTNGPNWVNLGSSFVSGGGGNIWVKTSIKVTPLTDIAAIAIGPDCPGVISPISIYYFFDKLVLADFESFQFVIGEVNHPCSNSFLLEVPLRDGLEYQWYKDGIALLNEKTNRIKKMYGYGDYQVRISDGITCKVTNIYKNEPIVIKKFIQRTICKDAKYPFGKNVLTGTGHYVDTFKTVNQCDSIVFLNLLVLGTISDTTSAKIFKGETFKLGNNKFTDAGDHLVHLVSSIGCDSLVLLQLDYFKIYFPNIFSPNEDGINDNFSLVDSEGLIKSKNIYVYDRWGSLVFSGESWDGKNKSNNVNPGVYSYVAKLTMSDGKTRQFTGNVTVIL